jgi:hypothetical protein
MAAASRRAKPVGPAWSIEARTPLPMRRVVVTPAPSAGYRGSRRRGHVVLLIPSALAASRVASRRHWLAWKFYKLNPSLDRN